jgi:hypothetical protein
MNGKDGATSRRQSSRGALVISEVLQKWAIVGVDAPHDASTATKHRTTEAGQTADALWRKLPHTSLGTNAELISTSVAPNL